MQNSVLPIVAILGIMSSCIGDDIIFDTVDETLRIAQAVDTLGIGDTYQFEAIFTNNVGQVTPADVQWSSSDAGVLSIDDQTGLSMGLAEGPAIVRASVSLDTKTLEQEMAVFVSDTTVITAPTLRSGSLKTTSSYTLEGNFMLEQEDDNLTLSFDDTYKASQALPGLFIYLTNNPTTTSGAFEIGAVDIFSGSHAYTLSTQEVALDQYSHVLYFCKPFNVKVGDGAFDN